MTATLKLKLRRADLDRVKRLCLMLSLLAGCTALQREDVARATTRPIIDGAIAAAVPQPWGTIAALIISGIGGAYLHQRATSKSQKSKDVS